MATVLEAHTQFTSGTNSGPYTTGNHDHMEVMLRVEPDGEPLTKLADLRDRRVLSEAELETAKAKLLGAG